MKLVESKQYTISAIVVAIILLILYGLSVGIVVQEENHRNLSKKLRQNRHTDFNTFLPLTNYSKSIGDENFCQSLKPSFKCPPRLLTHVGKSLGGGKWTCGLQTLETQRWNPRNLTVEPCLIYSFGVEDDSSFETEVLATTHCSVYAYDPTVPAIGKPLRDSNPRVVFEQFGIAGEDSGNNMTLATIMRINSHEGRNIAILKMDLEEDEYFALEKILEDFPQKLPFSQLLIELHSVDREKNPEKAEKILDTFRQLEKRGFRLFNCEPEDADRGRYSSEFSFVNLDSLTLFLEDEDIDELIQFYRSRY